MKRFTFAFVSFFLAACSLYCGTPGTLKWSIKPESSNIPSPAISKDGTVYVTGGSRLKALNPSTGGINWSYEPGTALNAAPVIMPDKSICVGGANGTLYIVNPSGSLKFSRNFGGGSINQQVAVSGDGNIFLAYGNTLYCLSPELQTIWTYVAADTLNSSPVLGQDGSIYLSCQTKRTFYAINIDGTLKWRQTYPWAANNSYDDSALLGTPSLGALGQVYVGDSAGYLREADPVTGALLREWAGMDRSSMTCQPAVHNNGYNIIGCTNVGIYGFHPTTGDYRILSYLEGATYSTPAIGSDGTVYLGVSYQTTYHTYYFYALTPVFGWSSWYFATRWSYFVGHQMTSSPALGYDGTAYIGTTDGYVYAIYTENTGYQNNSPFPKYRHDNSNTGNSMYNSFLTCQPSIYDFGNVNLGTEVSKTFSLSNVSTTSYDLGQIVISDSTQSETEFTLSDDCSGQAIAPGQTLQFTVTFRPLLNGRRNTSVKIPFADKFLYAGVFGTGGGNGQSSLIPVVYDGSNGQKLEGASITVNGTTLTTDVDGKCIFTALDPGPYTVEASKDGYSPNTKEVDLPASSNTYSNVILYPSGFTEPRVTDISSKYEGKIFYINDVNFNVKHTVNIDWGGHTPGKVKFTTPKGFSEETTSESVLSKTFNMGTDFGIGGTLKVQAVTDTGALSEEKEADFTVIKWIPLFPLMAVDKGGYFSYSSSLGLNWNLFNEGVDGSAIPSDIPLFGGNPVLLKLIPTVAAEVSWDGSASIELQYEGLQAEKKIDSGKLAGFSFSLYPLVNISGQYFPSAGDWNWDGYVGMHGEAEFKKSWPFVVMVGPVPVPMYAKASFSLEADAMLGIVELDPLSINGQLSIGPYVRGSLGAGVDELLAVEGWIGGGMDIGLQFPQEPTLEELSLYLNGGFTVYALLFTWENEVLRWDWSLIGGKTKSGNMPYLGEQPSRLLPRDYLNSPGYGSFTGGMTGKTKSVTDETGKSATIRYTTLQEDVFPYSEPSLSSAGSYLYAAWLYDDPARSSLNRTKLVFSSYDGSAWSTPQTVADDGTADFHPDLIVFPDGTAAVVWENGKAALADDATFDQMKQNLEICVSFYNPGTQTWSTPYTFTDNAYLDRSPKIRGSMTDLMVVWISNETSHVTGNTANPNKMYSCIWNGIAWAVPDQVVDNLTTYPDFKKPIISYDFAYNNTQWNSGAFVCIDMDDNTATDTDREIFRIFRYNDQYGRRWDTPRRISYDELADENVKFTWTDTSSLAYWIKGNAIYNTVPNTTGGTPVYTADEHTSNLASFDIARSPNGRLAVVWPEPSEFSSDLWAIFYDPELAVWGNPQQLTFDTQTERANSVAFYGEDTLVSLYDKIDVEISYEKRTTFTGKKVEVPVRQLGSADLAALMHTVSTDLALKPGSFVVSPANPFCGSVAELYATAMNIGNTPQQNINVSFYAGDPQAGGVLIETVVISSKLLPGEEKTVSVEWTVPSTLATISLYAVIDPDELIEGDVASNNTLTINCIFPDIGAVSLGRKTIVDNLLSLTGTVQNTGTLATGEFVVEIRKDNEDGQLLYSETIPSLEPNGIKQVAYLWDTTGVEMENVWLYLIADPADVVAEFDDGNNSYLLKINPFFMKGDVNRDGKIDISDVILCLRMSIGLPITINELSYESPYTDLFKSVADMNSSLDVNISDVILILRKSIGLDP